jgi:hypothetical protein
MNKNGVDESIYNVPQQASESILDWLGIAVVAHASRKYISV